jgi:hypothetical protein
MNQPVRLNRQQTSAAREILNDPHAPLQRMDVFLTAHKGNFISNLIKWGTQCFFSHAATTFLLPKRDEGFEHAFVMEAFGRGVEVRNGEKYFGAPRAYDFAIVRLKAPWIGGATEAADNLRKLARGRMLEHIEATYDHDTFLRLAWSNLLDLIFRRPVYLYQNYRERQRRARGQPFVKRRRAPREFVCSSFVSYAFYETALRLGEQEHQPMKYLPDVLFHPDFQHGIPPGMKEQEIEARVLATSPADLVRSDRFDWQWMVINGHPRRVTSREEALQYAREVYGPSVRF